MSEVVDMVRRLKEPSTVDKFVNAYTLKVQNVAESKNKLFAAISQAFCDPAWYTDTGTFSWRGKAILKLLECSAKDNDSIPIPSPLSWLPKSDKLNLALLPLHAYGSKLLGPVEDAWVRDIIKHLSSQPHASVLLWPSMLGALARLLAANGCKVIKDAKDATAQSTAVHVAHLLTRAQLPQHGDPTHDDAVAMEDLGAVFAVLWLKPHSDAMRVFLLHMCNTLVEKRAQTDLRGSPVILKQATRAQVKPFVLQMLAQFPKNTDRLHIVQGMLPWLQWPAVVETSIKPPQQQQTKGVGVPLWISEILAQLGKLKTTSPTDMQWLARTYGQRILDSCSHADRAAANFNVFRVLFLGVDGIDNEVEDVIPSLKSIVETNENSRDVLLAVNVVCSALAFRYPALGSKLEDACATIRKADIMPLKGDLCKRLLKFNAFTYADPLPANALPFMHVSGSVPKPSSTSSASSSRRPPGSTELASLHLDPTPRALTTPAGLRNLGNTCYLNSVMQVLYSLSDFRQRLKQIRPQVSLAKTPILYHACQLFHELETFPKSFIVPTRFVEAVRPEWFQPGQQQDSAEFLQYFLDRMHTELESISPSSPSPSHCSSCQSLRSEDPKRAKWSMSDDEQTQHTSTTTSRPNAASGDDDDVNGDGDGDGDGDASRSTAKAAGQAKPAVKTEAEDKDGSDGANGSENAKETSAALRASTSNARITPSPPQPATSSSSCAATDTSAKKGGSGERADSNSMVQETVQQDTRSTQATSGGDSGDSDNSGGDSGGDGAQSGETSP